jgi:2-polyprenyl-3-methyl-5-hydroxy-6-metoxy-1,4-benzoquinol methylase
MPLRDSERPPVLAHQRFVADRAAFAQLNLRERFQRIHDTNLWGADASVSGLGSEFDATATLRAELPALLRRLQVTSLLDAPCGDATWILRARLGVRIIGVDIVPDLIAALRERAARGDIEGEYHLADITQDALPRCDAILCRDCLVHLSFANIERALQKFRKSGAIWLITTTFPQWQQNIDGEDGDWRAEFRARAVFVGAAG